MTDNTQQTKTLAELEEDAQNALLALNDAKKALKEKEEDTDKVVDVKKKSTMDKDDDKDSDDDDDSDNDKKDDDKKDDSKGKKKFDFSKLKKESAQETLQSPFDTDVKYGDKKQKKDAVKTDESYREEDQPAVETLESPFDKDKANYTSQVAESIDLLFKGQDLSEEFKTRTATIFEAALKDAVSAEVTRIEEAAEEALAETVAEIEKDLNEKADAYVSYAVTQWIEENQLAVESSLKNEVMESFFEGLKNLFLEHNIEIPEGKEDVLEAKSNELEEMTAQNNDLLEKNIQLEKEILSHKKSQILAALSEGLADTQVEKFKKLTEDIEAKDVKVFEEKAKVIKEAYFSVGSSTKKEIAGDVKLSNVQEQTPVNTAIIEGTPSGNPKIAKIMEEQLAKFGKRK